MANGRLYKKDGDFRWGFTCVIVDQDLAVYCSFAERRNPTFSAYLNPVTGCGD
jgi:hypothetical protein